MMELEQSQQIKESANLFTRRRYGPRGILTLLKRAVVVFFYLPVVLVARWVLLTAHVHGEARTLEVTRREIALSRLPAEFEGLTIAFLSDFHCSAETPVAFLEQVVERTNALKPDLILLGGDYVTDGTDYINAVGAVLKRLIAPLGVFGVLGNHDFDADAARVRSMLKRAGVTELTNSGRWLRRGNSRIYIAGVGDLWEDVQDLDTALDGVQERDTVLLLSHNPDYAVDLDDPRVSLVLSGHTHGGQIRLPRIGQVITNTRYGRRLDIGLTRLGTLQLYVTRGIGTVMIPFRYQCPPEVALLTLRRGPVNRV